MARVLPVIILWSPRSGYRQRTNRGDTLTCVPPLLILSMVPQGRHGL